MQNLMMIYLKTILHQLNCSELLKPFIIDSTLSFCAAVPIYQIVVVNERHLSSILFSLQSHTKEHLILHRLI